MLGFLGNLIPGPYRIMAAGIAAVVIFGAGSTAGYVARDYLADRKEMKQLQANVIAWQKASEEWQVAAAKYRDRAKAAESKRQDNRTQAAQQSSTIDPAKLTTIVRGKCDVQTQSCNCERTAACHWLQLNAAYDGTDPPIECTTGLLHPMQGEHVPAAGVDHPAPGH